MTEEITEKKAKEPKPKPKSVYGGIKARRKKSGRGPGRPPKKKKEKIPRPAGRPKLCMPFEQARAIIHAEGLSSSADYERWWNANIPARIPKNPQRSYVREWKGWGDFLNSYNVWPESRPNYRDYHDARDYAHTLRLKSKNEWLELYRSGKIPKDIPMWPNISYGRTYHTGKPKRGGHWIGWRDWLGATLADQMVALNKRISVLLISTTSKFPMNVYAFSVFDGFDNDIRAQIKATEMRIVKAYVLEKRFDWGGYINDEYKKYYDGTYIIPNINDVFFYFDTFMDNFNV